MPHFATLPVGSSPREIRPDLVSLTDVTQETEYQEASSQKRELSRPALSGYYRDTEVAEFIASQVTQGRRKARFDVHIADPWVAAA